MESIIKELCRQWERGQWQDGGLEIKHLERDAKATERRKMLAGSERGQEGGISALSVCRIWT